MDISSSSQPSPPFLYGSQQQRQHQQQQPIEIQGPRDFQALSGDLVVWTRLSPLVFNLTGRLDGPEEEESLSSALSSLKIQLILLGEDGRTEDTLLVTKTLPRTISTAWEKVCSFCYTNNKERE
jgi:hypothetical protein